MELTNEDVDRILRLIDESSFDDIDIEWKGLRLRISRGGEQRLLKTNSSPFQDAAEPVNEAPPSAPSPVAQQPKAAVQAAAALAPGNAVQIRAPLMGTFYRAPEPGKAPFVDVGSVVAVGDTLCLVEVMKMFTAVTAEHAGRIIAVLPKDGQLIDYDEPLFLIESI